MAKRVRAKATDDREGDEADRWLEKNDPERRRGKHRDDDEPVAQQRDNGAFKVREPLDLVPLESGLRIDKNALDDGLLQQPDLFYRVSKALSLATSRRDAAKQGVADAEANVELSLHRSQEKYTVGEIKSQVTVSPTVRQARKMLADLQYEVNALNALKESFSQRSYALKELVSLYISNYYGDIDERAGRKVSEIQYKDNKRRLNEERKRQRGDD